MHRRECLAAFLSLARAPTVQGRSASTAALVDVRSRRLVRVDNKEGYERWLAAPGSILKPFSILALLDGGKLTPQEQYLCPRFLTVRGRSLNCSHPEVPLPMNASRAIAYSCNCTVAHFASRFQPGEFEGCLQRMGLTAHAKPESSALLAVGEAGILATPEEMLWAYRRLALRVGDPRFAPVLDGLEGAVEFGTAQAVRLNNVRVAGKTGSVRLDSGLHAAWFAGFAPARAPEVAVVVLAQGLSGGADAAPIASEFLRAYFARPV